MISKPKRMKRIQNERITNDNDGNCTTIFRCCKKNKRDSGFHKQTFSRIQRTKGYKMSGLTFYQSINDIDIWFDTDTRAGKTVYQFWFQGKAYERDTEKEIKDLARKPV